MSIFSSSKIKKLVDTLRSVWRIMKVWNGKLGVYIYILIYMCIYIYTRVCIKIIYYIRLHLITLHKIPKNSWILNYRLEEGVLVPGHYLESRDWMIGPAFITCYGCLVSCFRSREKGKTIYMYLGCLWGSY